MVYPARFSALLLSAMLLFGTAACTQASHPKEPPALAQAASAAASVSGNKAYTLGSGDRLRITVFGEPELSGEFDVDSIGKISMPLIGDLPVAKLTIAEVSHSIVEKLTTGYLRDPKVNIDVMNYRPFFIMGEVLKPSNYPYANGMTVVNAIAMAGGYTYRADKDNITVVRECDAKKTEYKIEEIGSVFPGDVVRVPERFF